MKKELCIDARMEKSSGIGTYISSLVPRIKNHYRIRLLVNQESSLFSDCEQIICASTIYSMQEQIEIPLKIPRCDLFWSPHFNVPLAPLRARSRLVTIHDVFFLACPEGLGLLKRAYARLFFHAAVKRSDHLITDSQFSLSEIGKYIGSCENKITTIPLGMDFQSYQMAGVNQEVKVRDKYILYVGNLALHKNISNLIRALDFLPEDVHLVLVGKETQWQEWKKEMIGRENRITVCGKVKQETLVWLYQNAVMLVHPSYYEGFGLTPLEAMSAGCPVVSSRAASLPEVCGDAVVYVDPFSVEAIARGVLSVWNSKEIQRELRIKGKRQAAFFDWDLCAQKHIEVIDRLLFRQPF